MTQAEMAYRDNLTESDEREQLIMDQLPRVYYIARRIFERLPAHVCFEDLVQAGVVGLIEAVGKYNPAKKVPFHAFAQFRIHGAIIDSIRSMDHGTRGIRRQGRRLEEAIVSLSSKLGRRPDDEEIAAEVGMSLDDLFTLAQRLSAVSLMQQRVLLGGDWERDVVESAEAKPEDGPFEQYRRTELRDKLSKVISTLSQSEQMVLSLYYCEELTMKEIAKVLDLSESRISQLHSLALARVKAAVQGSDLDPELEN